MNTSYRFDEKKSIFSKLCITAIALLTVFGLIGCATMHGEESPPQKDRLEGLAKPDQIKITNVNIKGSSKLKLAIVNSANVQPQLQSYSNIAKQLDTSISSYVTESKTLKADADIVLSDKIFLQFIISSLKTKFAEIFYANDLADAFNKGADYAAVIDLRYEFIDLSSRTVPGQITIKNVADVSALFIKKTLTGGPDVQIKNTITTEHKPSGAEANIRIVMNDIKNIRLKTLKDFETELSKVVIK